MMTTATIYLDNNATTPLDPRAADAMLRGSCQHFANPASQHEPGRQARRALEAAREEIARLLGARVDGMQADRLIFTSGATEANNLALRGLAGEPAAPGQPAPRIIVSAVEHPSVSAVGQYLAGSGFDVRQLPVDEHGVVRVDALAELLTPETRVVSVMSGNHETGTMQPVARLAKICNAAGVPLHTDAVQVAGKLPIDFGQLGVAALTVSAHKFHGPRGIGALLLRRDLALSPLLYGGFQQGGLRPGTESVALPLGMSAALEGWYAEREQRARRLRQLRDEFESALRTAWPEIAVHGIAVQDTASQGAGDGRLPHTSCISFPGLDRQALVMALDLAGVACATGSACASGSSEPSPVLTAMGCEPRLIGSAVRFSFGAQTTASEVSEGLRRILATLNDLRDRPQGRKSPGPARRHPQKSL